MGKSPGTGGREGRDPEELTLSLRWYLDPDGMMDAGKSVTGSVDQMLDTIGRLSDIGVSHVVLDPVAQGGLGARLAALERFATDVVPRVHP